MPDIFDQVAKRDIFDTISEPSKNGGDIFDQIEVPKPFLGKVADIAEKAYDVTRGIPLGALEKVQEFIKGEPKKLEIKPPQKPKKQIETSRLSEDEISAGHMNVKGVEVFREAGTGDLYRHDGKKYIPLSKDDVELVTKSDEWAMNKWNTEPWLDPTMVASGAFGATFKLASKAGLKEAFKRGVTAAIPATVMEYPIGVATEEIAEKYPKAALPFNIALGVLSGVTVERLIERSLVKSFGKSTPKQVAKYKKALSKGDLSLPKAKEVEADVIEAYRMKEPKPFEGQPIDITEPPKADIFDEIAPTRSVEAPQPTKEVAPEPIPRVEKEVPVLRPETEPLAAGGKVKVGKSPQPNTIVREIEATPEEKALGERFFEVKNDKTGEISTVTLEDIKPIKVLKKLITSEKGELKFRGYEEPEFTGDAKKAWDVFKENQEASRNLNKTSPKKIYEAIKRNTVDVSGNLKKAVLKHDEIGKKVVMHHDLIAGAHSKAIREVNEATGKIYRGLSQKEHDLLDQLINSRRTLAIEKYRPGIKHSGGLTAKEHSDIIKQFPPELKEKLWARADEFFSTMRRQLDEMLEEGLISKKSYDDLVSKGDYSPRSFLQHIDPDSAKGTFGQKINVSDSGLKKLDEGSYGAMEMDSSLLLSQSIERTQTRIFRNRANKALHELATSNPDNGIVRLARVIGKTSDGKPVYQKAPTGFEKVSAMIDGTQRQMLMPTGMAKEWVKSDPALRRDLANVISWISGAKILRPMATGINPEFALTNFPRDMAHVWLTTHEFSKFLPKAGVEMAMDIKSTLVDSIRRKGAYLDYINQGGGMEFLTHQGRFAPKLKGHFGTLQNVLGYLGETSEVLTRLALRNRAIRNGKSPIEATWIARNYLDFSQGGSFTKAVDSGVPYLNAAIQGTRGIFRSAAEKPGEFTFKVGQLMTVAGGLYMANKFNNPEAWEQIPHREKVNNWIITTPFSFTDKDGNKKWIYFKIAKDQGQRVIATLTENLLAKSMGEEVDETEITQAIDSFVPITPTGLLPPTLDALIGYSANKDFWRNEDIWRGPEVRPKEEYNRYTPDPFIQTGKFTGLSPERMKHVMSQFFTSGNIYTSMVGHGWKVLFDQMDDEDKNLVTEEIILKQPFVRKIAKQTNPYAKFETEIKEEKIKANTERYIATRNFDEMVQKHFDGEIERSDILSYIREQSPEERKRLINRFKNQRRLEGIPERRYWLNLMGMSPETRALVYWNRYRDAGTEEREMLDKYSRKIKGFKSPRFNRRLVSLKKKMRESKSR